MQYGGAREDGIGVSTGARATICVTGGKQQENTKQKVNGHGGTQVRYDKHFGHAWGSYDRGHVCWGGWIRVKGTERHRGARADLFTLACFYAKQEEQK